MTEPAPRLEPRQLAVSVIVALVVAAALITGIGRLAGFAAVGDVLEGASWPWLGLCAVGQILVFGGYAGAFRNAVRFEDGPVVARSFALTVIAASFGLTQLVAAGGAAGLAFTYWALRRLQFSRREAAVRLIGLNTTVYFVFGVLGFAAAAVVLVDADRARGMAVGWVVAFPIIVVAARWFTAESRIDRWTVQQRSGFRAALSVGVDAAGWTRRVVGSRSGRPLIVWAFLYWLGDLLSLWAALHAFGASIDIALLVVAHRVFAFWLPIGPGLWSATRLAATGSSSIEGAVPS